MKHRRWKVIALLAAGVAIGVVLTGTPATAHVGGTVAHLWKKHVKPKADKRYYTKSKADGRYVRGALGRGEALSGIYAVWGTTGGYAGDTVTFTRKLPAAIPSANVHFVPDGAPHPADCPAAGQAAAGHLCVYETEQGNRTFGNIFKPADGLDGAQREGFSIYFNTTGPGGSWSYGTWTVRAPSGAPAPRPAETAGPRAPAVSE